MRWFFTLHTCVVLLSAKFPGIGFAASNSGKDATTTGNYGSIPSPDSQKPPMAAQPLSKTEHQRSLIPLLNSNQLQVRCGIGLKTVEDCNFYTPFGLSVSFSLPETASYALVAPTERQGSWGFLQGSLGYWSVQTEPFGSFFGVQLGYRRVSHSRESKKELNMSGLWVKFDYLQILNSWMHAKLAFDFWNSNMQSNLNPTINDPGKPGEESRKVLSQYLAASLSFPQQNLFVGVILDVPSRLKTSWNIPPEISFYFPLGFVYQEFRASLNDDTYHRNKFFGAGFGPGVQFCFKNKNCLSTEVLINAGTVERSTKPADSELFQDINLNPFKYSLSLNYSRYQ